MNAKELGMNPSKPDLYRVRPIWAKLAQPSADFMDIMTQKRFIWPRELLLFVWTGYSLRSKKTGVSISWNLEMSTGGSKMTLEKLKYICKVSEERILAETWVQ